MNYLNACNESNDLINENINFNDYYNKIISEKQIDIRANVFILHIISYVRFLQFYINYKMLYIKDVLKHNIEIENIFNQISKDLTDIPYLILSNNNDIHNILNIDSILENKAVYLNNDIKNKCILKNIYENNDILKNKTIDILTLEYIIKFNFPNFNLLEPSSEIYSTVEFLKDNDLDKHALEFLKFKEEKDNLEDTSINVDNSIKPYCSNNNNFNIDKQLHNDNNFKYINGSKKLANLIKTQQLKKKLINNTNIENKANKDIENLKNLITTIRHISFTSNSKIIKYNSMIDKLNSSYPGINKSKICYIIETINYFIAELDLYLDIIIKSYKEFIEIKDHSFLDKICIINLDISLKLLTDKVPIIIKNNYNI